MHAVVHTTSTFSDVTMSNSTQARKRRKVDVLRRKHTRASESMNQPEIKMCTRIILPANCHILTSD